MNYESLPVMISFPKKPNARNIIAPKRTIGLKLISPFLVIPTRRPANPSRMQIKRKNIAFSRLNILG